MTLPDEWSPKPTSEVDEETARRREFHRLRFRWVDLNHVVGRSVDFWGWDNMPVAIAPGPPVYTRADYCEHHADLNGMTEDAACIEDGCTRTEWVSHRCSVHAVAMMTAIVMDEERVMRLHGEVAWPPLPQTLPTLAADLLQEIEHVEDHRSLLQSVAEFQDLNDSYFAFGDGYELVQRAESECALLVSEILTCEHRSSERIEALRQGMLQHFSENRVGSTGWKAGAWEDGRVLLEEIDDDGVVTHTPIDWTTLNALNSPAGL